MPTSDTLQPPKPEPQHPERSPLSTLIHSRHSIRFFKPTPFPTALLTECLHLSRLAPSNSNIQPWRLAFASGASRDRIVSAMHSAAATHGPKVPPLPDAFKRFRSEFGHLLYGPQGYDIPRGEKAKHDEAAMRNFAFFDAPTVGVVSVVRGLRPVDTMTVGMFLQCFLLALTEKGAGSCCMVSVTGFEEVLRSEFGIGEEVEVLCGLAIGWPEEKEKINRLRVPREDVGDGWVTFLE